MEVVLTQSDIDGMPAALRRQLLDYLFHPVRAAGAPEAEGAALDRDHLIALLREISFHRHGPLLRALLKRLAHEGETPPSSDQLAGVLPPGEREQLARHVATLNRLAVRAAGGRRTKLCWYDRARRAYVTAPRTRRLLRELLPQLERAEPPEEPRWE